MRENQVKATAVMEFVEMMIGAFEDGYTDTTTLNLAQLHQVACNHVKLNYGIDIERLDKDTYKQLSGLPNLNSTTPPVA